MASIARDPNGTKRILFVDRDGNRRTVRLGRVSVKTAEGFKLRIEALNAARAAGTAIDNELAGWLRDLGDVMHERLVRVELAEPRAAAAVVALGELLKRFDAAAVVKPSTRAAYRQAIESLREHLGDDTELTAITPADADDWRKALVDQGYAAATIAKRTNIAKTIFRKAVRWRLLPSSPFADLRTGSQSNPERNVYVTANTITAVMEACPDDQWRAIIALSRYAGLRCPSEILLLRWGDVNWERSRLTARSPKTAAHEGHAVRVVPIAPELRPVLLALFEQAEPGAEAVIPRLREPGANLRTTFQRIIRRAGETPWPRLFQNLRASCETDWCERFPAHVAAKWLGHSPLIAARHYVTARDAHFDLASGAKCGALEAQNAAQQPPASDRTESQDSLETPCFAGAARKDAATCEAMQNGKVGATGLEPVTSAM